MTVKRLAKKFYALYKTKSFIILFRMAMSWDIMIYIYTLTTYLFKKWFNIPPMPRYSFQVSQPKYSYLQSHDY